MSDGLPWDFGEAERRLGQASVRQQAAEDALREAYKAWGEAQQRYALKLALAITELRADGIPVTVCLELAKGAPEVARLRMERDVAEGVREAAQQASWRRNADRKDCQSLARWSERREQAEAAGGVRHEYGRPIGVGA